MKSFALPMAVATLLPFCAAMAQVSGPLIGHYRNSEQQSCQLHGFAGNLVAECAEAEPAETAAAEEESEAMQEVPAWLEEAMPVRLAAAELAEGWWYVRTAKAEWAVQWQRGKVGIYRILTDVNSATKTAAKSASKQPASKPATKEAKQ